MAWRPRGHPAEVCLIAVYAIGSNQQLRDRPAQKHRYAEQSRMKRRNGGILVSYPGEFLEYEQRLLIPPFFSFFLHLHLPIHISCQFILLAPSGFASFDLSVKRWTLDRLVQVRTMFIHNLQGWNRKRIFAKQDLNTELANGCIFFLYLLSASRAFRVDITTE